MTWRSSKTRWLMAIRPASPVRRSQPSAKLSASVLDWAAANAAKCDVTIACMGLLPSLEWEHGDAILSDASGDRSNIALPAVQQALIKQLVQSGAKVVLVLTGGSPIALGEVADLIQAIVFAWYPGQAGGAPSLMCCSAGSRLLAGCR